MAFSVNPKYIENTEVELGIILPGIFKTRMINKNGGGTLNDEFRIFPFWDKTDKKRLKRTCNHIALETKNAQNWNGFPEKGIAIGTDDCGNYLVLIPRTNNVLTEEVYLWNHETTELSLVANNINDLDKGNKR